MWVVICFCCKCPVFTSWLKMSDSNRSSAFLWQRAALTPHSQQPQRESNPRLRSDSPVYWPLYDGAIYLLYPWSYLIRISCTFLRTNEKPPVLSDKRQSQCQSLRFIWSSHGPWGGSRSQTSTWSGLIKAYANKPFRFLSGRHNCPLKIKLTVCIFHSVCMYLQHCLSFPDLLSFFLLRLI